MYTSTWVKKIHDGNMWPYLTPTQDYSNVSVSILYPSIKPCKGGVPRQDFSSELASIVDSDKLRPSWLPT